MTLHGHVDLATCDRIAGWAWDDTAPATPVSLVISADGQVLGRCLAELHRPDLAAATGGGTGHHAFDFNPAGRLPPGTRHQVAVRREGDGTHLDGSPAIIEPDPGHDEAHAEAHIAALAAELDRLRQRHADRQSGLADHQRRQWQRAHEQSGTPAPASPPRALVIDETLPHPDRDAGSNAVLSHARSLQRLGFQITFAASNMQPGPSLDGIETCTGPVYTCVEDILRRQPGAFDLIYLHRGSIAAQYLGIARRQNPAARILYSVADLRFLRESRQGSIEHRPELQARSTTTRMTELAAAALADAVITHSPAEAALLRQSVPGADIHTIPWHVPPSPTRVPFAARRGLAFIGSYTHPPNLDAAHWLARNILPELHALDPTIPCYLVGSGMPGSLRRLARPGLEPLGAIPSLATLFDRIRLTVAPLGFGAGIKGKVLDSLAAGIPCVCTQVAAEGLDLPPPLDDQIATTPAALAEKIHRLHEDELLNTACAKVGLTYIESMNDKPRIDRLMHAAARLQQSVSAP